MRAAFDVTYAILDNSTPPDPRKFHAKHVDSNMSDLGKSGIYLRHGPEAQAVFATFACAFLLKVRASSCLSSSLSRTNATHSYCNPAMHHTCRKKTEWRFATRSRKSQTSSAPPKSPSTTATAPNYTPPSSKTSSPHLSHK